MQHVKSEVVIKNCSHPDEVRRFDKGKVELVKVGDTVVGRATFEPGWKWSECVKPIAKTDSCQSAHLGYQVSGTMKIVSDDGSSYKIKPGDAFELPPGHDAWVEGDEAVVVLDFQGMSDYAKPTAGSKRRQSKRAGRRH